LREIYDIFSEDALNYPVILLDCVTHYNSNTNSILTKVGVAKFLVLFSHFVC